MHRKTEPLHQTPWQALVVPLTSEKVEDRLEAIRALARAGKQTCLEAQLYLREALGDEAEQVRVEAAKACALLGDEAPIDALMCALTEHSWQVRTVAAQTLGVTCGTTEIPHLIKLLKPERDENVREAIVRALGKQGHSMPVDILINVLLHDQNWLVRTAAAWALGELDELAPIDPLLKALQQDADESVRAAAAKALGKSGNPAVIDYLFKALDDPEMEVQDAVDWALQQFDKEARGLKTWGPVYHFDEEPSPQARAFLEITQFLRDKKGWLDRSNMLQTARGPALHLNFFYQSTSSFYQTVMQQPLNNRSSLEPLVSALNERDPVVEEALKHAIESRKDRPWLDLLVVSFVLTSSKNGPREKNLRVIISGMGLLNVRAHDVSVLDLLVDAWCKAVEEPPVSDNMNNRTPVNTTNLLDLRVWYDPITQEAPELTMS
ncbi:MAG TPA: HEAT repeat domain-containing protein [Ktedonobacteraceae bacterium]|nr:HEAT repeat domain-containing protein [Ktedonobacteraceae bacterium]